MATPELLRFIKRGVRQGTWPILQRYVVAPRITDLPRVTVSTTSEFCVHVYICESHSLMLHWALRSLINVCTTPFQLMLHDDGSCSAKTLDVLSKQFKGVRIIKRGDAARQIRPKLEKYPLLRDWWPTNARSINVKWLDAHVLGDSKYVILLDSDILFFQDPKELFEASPRSVWMKDSSYMLEISPEESVSLFGGYPLLEINAGLGRTERSRFNLELAERVLAHLGKPRDDMTMHAVVSAQYPDVELLPPSYVLTTAPGLNGSIAKHYTTPFRFLLYEEGIPHVARQLQLSLPRWLRERG